MHTISCYNNEIIKETPVHPITSLSSGDFDAGVEYTNWRSHGTNDWLLIFTVEGRGIVASGDVKIVTRPGCVTLYQPQTPQSYFTEPKHGHWRLLWSHFLPKPSWKAWLNWPEQTRGLRTIMLNDTKLFENVELAMLDATRFIRQPLPGNVDLAYNSLERAILWINSANLHSALDERIRKAIDYLVEELDHPFSLEKLAKACSLSVSRLAHLFSEQIGTSPQQYQERLRMQWAAELLRTCNLSVLEISSKIGYSNAFYFSARFKKIFGKSPSLYRRTINH